MLFFSGAVLCLLGHKLLEFEDGHEVLTRRAWQALDPTPTFLTLEGLILGNLRTDLRALRPDHTIGLGGIMAALLEAQFAPKFQHGMRQSWHHPTRSLPRVQMALYQRVARAWHVHPDGGQASELLGGALHTLQDTYTLGHTQRTDNGDPHAPLLRLYYSPSRAHPFISPHDRVWADRTGTQLTAPAQAAICASQALLTLFADFWGADPAQQALALGDFINRFTPVRGQVFAPPASS